MYAYLLALFYRLLGRDFYLVFLFQIAASSLSAVLIYLLGKNCLTDPREFWLGSFSPFTVWPLSIV